MAGLAAGRNRAPVITTTRVSFRCAMKHCTCPLRRSRFRIVRPQRAKTIRRQAPVAGRIQDRVQNSGDHRFKVSRTAKQGYLSRLSRGSMLK